LETDDENKGNNNEIDVINNQTADNFHNNDLTERFFDIKKEYLVIATAISPVQAQSGSLMFEHKAY